MSTRFLTVKTDDEAIVELVDAALDEAVLFADVAKADMSSLLLPIDMRNSSCSLVSGDRNDRVLSLVLLFIFSLLNAKSTARLNPDLLTNFVSFLSLRTPGMSCHVTSYHLHHH